MNTSVKMSPDSFSALPPSSGSSWRTIAAAEGRASARESPDRQRSKCGKTFIKALNFYSDSDLKKKSPGSLTSPKAPRPIVLMVLNCDLSILALLDRR